MADFKGTREAFAQAIIDMAETDDKIMFVSPDSLKAMRATKFAELHPEQYVEVGISEQAAVDVASGLAASGLTPFVGTYAGFMTMRACEQMRTFVAYPNLNVKFVGINSGLLGGEREGVTHQFYEDIGILSNIPNFTILTPADGPQTYHAVKAAAEIPGPVYVRAGSGRENDVYEKDVPFTMDGLGKQQFDFYHFNSYTAQWETNPFIANNISSSYYSLVDGHEMANELSFQVTSVNPLDIKE